ncbi:hypothetical protein EYF80_041977 [Liparis tanakae]|uniref:Uncharacterized protein n=1 Tax=Liparis tanakae TaxID=230148 RepID=A0A4Z2G4W8_9TELE|nr:hypothetical protein EYF80_041977 [Liparis tanakae]
MLFRNRLICQDNGPLATSQGAVQRCSNQMPGNRMPTRSRSGPTDHLIPERLPSLATADGKLTKKRPHTQKVTRSFPPATIKRRKTPRMKKKETRPGF